MTKLYTPYIHFIYSMPGVSHDASLRKIWRQHCSLEAVLTVRIIHYSQTRGIR